MIFKSIFTYIFEAKFYILILIFKCTFFEYSKQPMSKAVGRAGYANETSAPGIQTDPMLMNSVSTKVLNKNPGNFLTISLPFISEF